VNGDAFTLVRGALYSVVMQIDPIILAGVITGLFTLATGWFAIKVFKLQKSGEKTNAAISILFEVRNAEEKIEVIREKLNSNSSFDLPSVLPTDSWRKYSHLFAADFDEDELKLLNSFYTACGLIEDLVGRQNNFIWVAAEEKARTAQRLLGEIHVELQRDASAPAAIADAHAKFAREREGITKYYGDEQYLYAPQKTLEGLKFGIGRFQKVTTTTCGAKLKTITKA
jgi:hypothetical protein